MAIRDFSFRMESGHQDQNENPKVLQSSRLSFLSLAFKFELISQGQQGQSVKTLQMLIILTQTKSFLPI